MPPLSLTAGDCAICLGRVRRRWEQPMECTCRPIVHEACWLQWAAKRGPRCIICRGPQPEPLPEQQQQQQAVLVVFPPEYTTLHRLLIVAMFFAYVAFVLVGPGRKIMRQFHEL